MITEVEGLYVGDFHCEENFMSYWWPLLREVDVPTPVTYGVELVDGEPDYEYIVRVMEEEGWEQAFIRGDGFSDKVNPKNGSWIREPSVREVERTFETLKNHLLNHLDTPLGEAVFLREPLDLDYCSETAPCGSWHPTELRFLVEGGRIRYVSPSLEVLVELNASHGCTFDYVEERLLDGFDGDLREPTEEALKVAEAFDEYAWHVDFVLDTSMEWYCIDMGVDGVYWNEEAGEWSVMTGNVESVERQKKRRANEVLPEGGYEG
jgi:hypothetical protein